MQATASLLPHTGANHRSESRRWRRMKGWVRIVISLGKMEMEKRRGCRESLLVEPDCVIQRRLTEFGLKKCARNEGKDRSDLPPCLVRSLLGRLV